LFLGCSNQENHSHYDYRDNYVDNDSGYFASLVAGGGGGEQMAPRQGTSFRAKRMFEEELSVNKFQNM